MKKATLADVAELANVSKATVSRYLKDESVRKDIAEKIAKAIEETGYVMKNVKASVQEEFELEKEVIEKKIIKKKTTAKKVDVKKGYRFAILVKDIHASRTRNVIQNLQKEVYANGCMFQILITDNREDLEEQYLTACIVSNVNAIIVESCSSVEFIQKQMRTTAIPVLYLNAEKEGIHSLSIDEKQAGEELGKYLLQNQYLTIRYLGLDNNTAHEHLEGIKKVYHDARQPQDIMSQITDGSYLDMLEKIKVLFAEKIDLLILERDEMAIPLSKYLKEYHVSVPQNVSVVSFGGHDLTKVMSPTLTCLSYDYEQYTKNIMNYVLALIEKKPLPEGKKIFSMQEGESVR